MIRCRNKGVDLRKHRETLLVLYSPTGRLMVVFSLQNTSNIWLKPFSVLINCTLLNKACFLSTPCKFLNTSRCVVVTHLLTVLFHGLRKRTIASATACKETHKVCIEYTPLCLLITHLKICLNTQ